MMFDYEPLRRQLRRMLDSCDPKTVTVFSETRTIGKIVCRIDGEKVELIGPKGIIYDELYRWYEETRKEEHK